MRLHVPQYSQASDDSHRMWRTSSEGKIRRDIKTPLEMALDNPRQPPLARYQPASYVLMVVSKAKELYHKLTL